MVHILVLDTVMSDTLSPDVVSRVTSVVDELVDVHLLHEEVRLDCPNVIWWKVHPLLGFDLFFRSEVSEIGVELTEVFTD